MSGRMRKIGPMSTSGCGTKPDPSPWRVDERKLDGRVVLARTEWVTTSQAHAYVPTTKHKTFATEAEAEQFIRDCPWWPVSKRRTESGIKAIDRELVNSFAALSREARTFAPDRSGRLTVRERRLLDVRELHKHLDRIAASRGLPTGGW